MKSLAERIRSLRSFMTVAEANLEVESILADVRELESALALLVPMFAEWHAEFPDNVGDKEGPAMQRAVAILVKTGAIKGDV